MKTFILTLVTFVTLLSCEEENTQPVQPDAFVGTWQYSNPSLDLNISFDVTQDGSDLFFKNIKIEYPEITESLNYRAETYYRFAVNDGYKEIKIFGEGSEEWIIINMTHNRVHLKTPAEMDVYQMQVNMINRAPIELQNQVFTKTNQ